MRLAFIVPTQKRVLVALTGRGCEETDEEPWPVKKTADLRKGLDCFDSESHL